MSKITIFLCAVLFAARRGSFSTPSTSGSTCGTVPAKAVDATYLTNALAAAQQRVEALVASEIAKVERNYEDAKKRATQRSEQLEKSANEFSDKVAEDVKKIEKKVEEDIKKLIDGTKDVDVSECNKENERLHELASAVNSNMTACIVDKKETGNAYVENINAAATDVLGNLAAIRDEAHRCGENVVGITSALSAIACTKMAGVKAAWVSARAVPALTVNMGKMNYLLSTVQPSLAYCTTTHGLAAFYHESRMIIRKTKICIQQKVDEARRNPTTVKDDAVEAETAAPVEEVSAESTVPAEEVTAESTVPAEEVTAESTVPAEEVSAESTVPSEEVSTESTVVAVNPSTEAAVSNDESDSEAETASAEP